MLKGAFITIIKRYAPEETAIQFWQEIVSSYRHKERFYHNLKHLENIFQQLYGVREIIEDRDTTVMSICYHDIIYDISKTNNEERSAAFAIDRLSSINYNSSGLALCEEQILATKSHQQHNRTDVDLFTDADLSILGADQKNYMQYADAIRKEYAIYPDVLYKSGRKKVLQHFLQMDFIFKTRPFRGKYELQAKENLSYELNNL